MLGDLAGTDHLATDKPTIVYRPLSVNTRRSYSARRPASIYFSKPLMARNTVNEKTFVVFYRPHGPPPYRFSNGMQIPSEFNLSINKIV